MPYYYNILRELRIITNCNPICIYQSTEIRGKKNYNSSARRSFRKRKLLILVVLTIMMTCSQW